MAEAFIPANGSAGNSAPVGGFIPVNGTAGNSAPTGGRKLKKVSAKTIKRTLRKLGMKPKGRVVLKGGELQDAADAAAPAAPAEAPVAGKRRRGGATKKKRSASRRRSSFPF